MTKPIRLFQAAFSQITENAALEVLRSGQIASGPRIDEFQKRFGQMIGRNNVVCTSDMTNALALALRLSGVGTGDEVLTIAFSCMASNSAISIVGAKPVWVDIDPKTASMSIADLKNAITPRCKAVTVYHVAGYPAPLEQIADFCKQRGLFLIEDCNNSLGATLNGTPVGNWGDYAVFSFYPNRQINAIDGGALVCPNEETATRASKLRRFGVDATTFRDAFGEINPASNISEVGWSASFTNLNAAVGLTQLSNFSSQLARTRTIVNRMQSKLRFIRGLTMIQPIEGSNPAYWVLLLLVEQRDKLLQRLKGRQIDCSKLHFRNDIYSGFGSLQRNLSGTDIFMSKVLAIPCGWWLSDDQADTVVATICEELQE